MTAPEIVLVAARADNGVIGRDGGLPWHLPADLRRFKALTLGTPMIMGRRTFDSLPGLLPGRRHIVLTRDANWSAPGAEVASSPEAALALTEHLPVVSVIGGSEVFALFLDRAHRIELTEVHADIAGDTIMRDPRGPGWREVARERHNSDGDRHAYSFVTLRRRLA